MTLIRFREPTAQNNDPYTGSQAGQAGTPPRGRSFLQVVNEISGEARLHFQRPGICGRKPAYIFTWIIFPEILLCSAAKPITWLSMDWSMVDVRNVGSWFDTATMKFLIRLQSPPP